MKDVKFGNHTIPVPRPIDALVTRGVEALSKLTVEQRGEILNDLPASNEKISGGLSKRLLRASPLDLENKIAEHPGLLKVSQGLVTDLQFASWLTQPDKAKPEMAEALAKMAVLNGVSAESLGTLVKRLELIADIQTNGGIGMITQPLQARLYAITSDFPMLLKQVQKEIEMLAYEALQKKIDVLEPKA